MSAWQHVPGGVVPCSVVVARCGAAAASPKEPQHQEVLSSSSHIPFDADITTGYVDTLLRHCSHAFHFGTASHLVFGGDADWFQGVLPNTLVAVLSKFVTTSRELLMASSSSASMDTAAHITAGSFHVDGRSPPCFDANVMKYEIRASDSLELCRRACGVLTALNSTSKIAWVRASIPDYMGCEISNTFFILPPAESISWEVHRYLRQVDEDLLISRNALTMFVWHTTKPSHNAASDARNQTVADSTELFVTLSKQKERYCAAIPNTPAAKYLLRGVDGHSAMTASASSPAGGGGGGSGIADGNGYAGSSATLQGQREDIQALEGEVVSLRAACIQLSSRNQQLEADMQRLKAITAQQQQLHQALLTGGGGANPSEPLRGSAGLAQRGAGLLLPPMEGGRAIGGHGKPSMSRLGAVATAQQQQQPHHQMLDGAEALMEHLHEMGTMVGTIQSSMFSAAPFDVLKGCLVWRQREAETLMCCLRSVVTACRHDIPPSLAATTPLGHLTVGASAGVDPLTQLYASRLQEVEREVVRLCEFDVEGLASQFYTDEMRRLEGEIVSWMTKYFAKVGGGAANNTTAQ